MKNEAPVTYQYFSKTRTRERLRALRLERSELTLTLTKPSEKGRIEITDLEDNKVEGYVCIDESDIPIMMRWLIKIGRE